MRILALTLSALLLPVTTAYAYERAYGVIRAEVPLVCTATLSSAVLEDLNGEAGQMQEFCNNSRGYRVLAAASGDVSGSLLLVDGVAHRLEPGQEVEIVSERSARKTQRALAFQPASTEQTGTISVRVVIR
jgi:hypothetical protein